MNELRKVSSNMAKATATQPFKAFFESFGTPWIRRSKNRKPLDINMRKGSTIISKKNTTYTKPSSKQQLFLQARFKQLECMWNELTTWQRQKIAEFAQQTKIGKNAKSCFFKLGMRFDLDRLLSHFGFNPQLQITKDEETNKIIITVSLDDATPELLQEQATKGEWERALRYR